MTIQSVGAVGAAGAQPATEAPKQKFSEALHQAKQSVGPENVGAVGEARNHAAANGRVEVEPLRASAPTSVSSPSSVGVADAARAVERVGEAQQKLDQILQLAESGKSFTPAELLAMQAQVYRASQEIDLASKVVDKATSGIKQVLQTNV